MKWMPKNNNPANLELGKEYWFRHIPSSGKWIKGKITRITENGHVWMEAPGTSGIVSQLYYEISSTDPTPPEKMYTREDMLRACKAAFVQLIDLPYDTVYFEEWVREYFDKKFPK